MASLAPMNFFDVILSTQVIAGILVVSALVMSVRSILYFTREASGMAPRLQKIEMDLAKLRDSMGAKREVVRELTQVVDPLKEREGRLRAYFEHLKNLELDHDREAAQKTAKDEEEKRRRIQRKKMGFE